MQISGYFSPSVVLNIQYFMSEEKISPLKKIFASKSLSYPLILLLIFALVSFGREVNRRLILKKQSLSLENQISSLERENQDLIGEIEKMKTEYFKEKAARLDLGLQRPGEQVIVVVPSDNGVQKQDADKESSTDNDVSHFKIWWRYFFGRRKD